MLHRYLMACFKWHFQFTKLFKKSCTERNLKILHYNTMLNKFCSYLTLNIGQIFSIQIIACVYLKKKTTLTQFLSHKISCLYIFQDLCTLRTHLELRATSVSPTSMEPWFHLLLSSTSSWKACSTQRLKSALERSDIVLIHMDPVVFH